MCYERAPRGSGDLRGVLFVTFYMTLKGSCVTVSPRELVGTNAKQCSAMRINAKQYNHSHMFFANFLDVSMQFLLHWFFSKDH